MELHERLEAIRTFTDVVRTNNGFSEGKSTKDAANQAIEQLIAEIMQDAPKVSHYRIEGKDLVAILDKGLKGDNRI